MKRYPRFSQRSDSRIFQIASVYGVRVMNLNVSALPCNCCEQQSHCIVTFHSLAQPNKLAPLIIELMHRPDLICRNRYEIRCLFIIYVPYISLLQFLCASST